MKIYLFGRRTIASAIIVSIISGLIFFFQKHNIPITENMIWKIYYEVQKLLGDYFPNQTDLQREIQDQLNRRLIEDEELLEYKVRRDVDDVILEYERKERESYVPNMKNETILKEIEKPKYSETQRQILKDAIYYEFDDGTMGIRGAWVSPDSREIHLDNENK